MKYVLSFCAAIVLVFLVFSNKKEEKIDTYRNSMTLETTPLPPQVDLAVTQETQKKPSVKRRIKRVIVDQPLLTLVEQNASKPEEEPERVVVPEVQNLASRVAGPRTDTWTVQNLPKADSTCVGEDSCMPSGRDGVLMVGTSVLPQSLASRWRGELELGHYGLRTPLLHFR